MSAYILSVLGVVLFSAIVVAILPDGKTATFIKSITRLVCVFAVVSPFLSEFQKGEGSFVEDFFNDSVINLDDTYIDYCSKISVESAEKELESTVFETYGVLCDVTLDWEYETQDTEDLDGFFLFRYEGRSVKITELRVEIASSVSEDVKEKIKFDLQTGSGCEVTIVEHVT